MPPSQLKRLKSSLREQGITGPQKSQKQKKAASKDASGRVNRNAALQQIRDSFNPFELKPAKPAKFESVSHKSANAIGKKYKEVLHRPGVSKSAGEEMRRAQLLPEMRGRNKVGGLIDRRIGEGDASMTAEARAAERYAREKKKGTSLFDLEGSDDEANGIKLTHLGKNLDEFDGDDFPDDISGGSDDGSDNGFLRRKRRRSNEDETEFVQEEEEKGGDQPERKKTKKEVMQEVIAKSKMHKYERQKTKEDDDDIREELDKGMNDMLALLQGHPVPPKPVAQAAAPAVNEAGPMINPDRQRLLDGMDRQKADKEYEVRLRQLAMDTRAQPSDRSKTDEEKAAQEATRLKQLEDKRAKRMRGEDVSDDEDDKQGRNGALQQQEDSADMDTLPNEDGEDQAAEFGLASSLAQTEKGDNVLFDDEDEFAVDEDLVASDSDPELSDDSEGSDAGSDAEADAEQEEEDEFVKGILGGSSEPTFTGANTQAAGSSGFPYSYPCPRSHEELLDILKDKQIEQLPTIIQRIRALHHSSLSASNKEAMADFSTALVDHLSHMGINDQPLAVIEQVIRHLHSLSRTYPDRIGEAFREHLQAFHERGSPSAGDLVILTAIGSIYPTSDHFHQVVTPAITLMARWLGVTAATAMTSKELATGAFITALSLNYQKLSKRYVPEAVRFTLKVLSAKPILEAKLAAPHIINVTTMADLWKDKTAFVDIFNPFLQPLQKHNAKKAHQHIKILLQQSTLSRRPLELHHHKEQPIRMSVPKFEEGFNPDKHYDPDKERSEAKKLQKEYKREKKGAVRELRKDANFIAREQLREKRIRDEEHDKKQRRLIAEIQGEEGREAKESKRWTSPSRGPELERVYSISQRPRVNGAHITNFPGRIPANLARDNHLPATDSDVVATIGWVARELQALDAQEMYECTSAADLETGTGSGPYYGSNDLAASKACACPLSGESNVQPLER
ncbi:putative nucleolar complex protein 14 [Acrodontium crateriforme]|uniref:Nucleolar complex protein 14 n=1 Tax=Acrodontium crateriforme TaxID=150365 RepID=A0AAQ3RD98_9PEZI|nr:putative nucleolar complex protein 14 [Acrodontium crateriforme]